MNAQLVEGRQFMTDIGTQAAVDRATAIASQARNVRLEWRGQLLPRVTISIGVGIYPQHGATLHDVFDWPTVPRSRRRRPTATASCVRTPPVKRRLQDSHDPTPSEVKADASS